MRKSDSAKTTTRLYYEEYFNECDYGAVISPKLHLGPRALQFINKQVHLHYKQFKPTLPLTAPDSADGCVNQFWIERKEVIERALRGKQGKSDQVFEAYIKTSVDGWFHNLYSQTDEGKARDAIRKRLARDARFTNNFDSNDMVTASSTNKKLKGKRNSWGLVGGPTTPSTVPERTLESVTYRYPIDIDVKALQDEDRQRTPNYGKTGQLENMFEGVLKAAKGTLALSSLFTLAQHRLSVMQQASTQSLTTDDGGIIDIAAPAASVEDQVFSSLDRDSSDEEDMDRQARILELVKQIKKASLNGDPKKIRRYFKQHPAIADELLTYGINPYEQKA
ncbi:hypothetical protein BLI708_11095 [Bifidobacterium imperatoris]|uniref:Uncharacterized protein n=1 Tax=Bifidobacterium imperatoris TaxID=2020965 RepID=A0A2N5IT78_9BIFI|nr:hypothetical protein [Bifidobacterium imperatoris]PLS25166.1 hypothetical protein Tam1G_0732 [Bifidobacterium imperatoris]QSY57719.1 hypothetical protein BLI708_11095 [Bifidobacterium imperatoris]